MCIRDRADTVLRSLRDEPGYWWETYRRVWKRNARESLVPGMLTGLVLSIQIFTPVSYTHLDVYKRQPCGFAPLPAALHPAGLAADKDPKMRRNPQSTPECSLRVRCAALGRVGILLAGTALLCAAFGCGTNAGSTAFYMV